MSCFVLFFCFKNSFAQTAFPDIIKNKNGTISCTADSKGNQIPDFSYAGYRASEIAIPNVENKIFVPKQDSDATQKIQAAIDYVSSLKPNKSGFRGAVLLDNGTFKLNGTLYIKTTGVVLRGSGNSENGTLLLGTGIKRESVIRVVGINDIKYGETFELNTSYSPLGTQKIQLKNASKLKTSDEIVITKPLTDNWIKELKMDDFGGETGWIGWKSKDWDIRWNRVVTKVNGNEVTLNAPLTMALDAVYGETKVTAYTWSGRIEQIGIENLLMKSTYNVSNLKDEEHRWLGISIENAKDVWVRQVNFKHFAGGAISVLKSAQQITVEDCMATEPISEIASFRRHTFYTEGQQTLFQRCYSEYGYHDFAVGGYGTTGPNAFVQCESFMPYSNNGAIGSWATGVLFDIAYVDGQALSYNNREQTGRGAGWTAANSVIWETSASKIECYNPPTAQNWAFGTWGGIMAGDGHWKDVNNHITPRSLFYAQLGNRFEKLPLNPYIYDLGSEPSSSPTVDVAQELTKNAVAPKESLVEWITEVSKLNPIDTDSKGIKSANDLKIFATESINNKSKVTTRNGWLTFDGKLIAGKQTNVMWWRGSLRDSDVSKSSPHLTRFVPGQRGTGLTDNINEVVDYLSANNTIALEHNYGLWYERRMDDHERVRRIDADVWPPFYEQPFARSGKELAWDQLSKYDLTKFNDWYWDRLARFATLAEPKGQLLINQQYFQHNIIEAGAHWSSSPWRSANNINTTGFPEPPPYAGDKRIFMAEQFYDITNPVRRKLHQGFIRKSFENFQDNSNVIQLTSAEYTGPLHFTQFWLDEAQKWKDETGKKSIIGLSATKDVQDAILNDAKRAKTVDAIDIRYWYYKEDGTVYAPEGGKNLAPRQHARQMKTGKETDDQVYRAVSEYREKYPNKVILYSTDGSSRFGWAALMGGASLPTLPKIELPTFYSSIPMMKTVSGASFSDPVWKLENKGESYLFYVKNAQEISIDLTNYKGNFEMYSINPSTGNITKNTNISGGKKVVIPVSDVKEKVLLVVKKN
ncbi:pectate lyase [Flavobacterium cellulosilyticum]|uniref:Pectate lyase n=2 Tax=Flavobacterium cellulosilyticum TaxID=2541731 RepID=A0A4R5CIC0_9FLAO|nr:pectate lyase [Flavobacterium cellulosilyticum]